MPAQGRLIVFEGGEGSGKSTQAALLAARLGAVLTREPGGTSVGIQIRGIVLGPGSGPSIDMRAEALLMAADRAQHVAEVIRPALARGRDVVCDRFTGSTLAYQGHARGLDLDDLTWLSRWAADGLEAEVILLLDVSEDLAAARMSPDHDRIEAAGADFHRRVADGYRALAAADPSRWRVVDGSGSVEEVEARVLKAMEG